MAAKKNKAGYDFLVEALKADQNAVYADLRDKAEKKGLTIYPVMYGRAKAMLGHVPSAKRGEGKTAKAAAAKRSGTPTKGAKKKRGRPVGSTSKSLEIRALLGSGMSAAEIAEKVGCTVGLVYNVKSTQAKATSTTKRGPGRPPKAAKVTGFLDDIVAAVKNSEQQRTQMRAALEKIQAILADALA